MTQGIYITFARASWESATGGGYHAVNVNSNGVNPTYYNCETGGFPIAGAGLTIYEAVGLGINCTAITLGVYSSNISGDRPQRVDLNVIRIK